MARNENSKLTKEIILDAAFSFLEEPKFTEFSMNSLASKLNVTKPAIYRHFTNKEAVFDAMENRVIENLSVFLKEINPENTADPKSKKALASAIEYFIQNPTHINYLIAQLSSNPNYEEHMFKKMTDQKIPFILEGGGFSYLERFTSNIANLSRHVFSGMTIFYFVKLREEAAKRAQISETSLDFGEKLVKIIFSGLSGTTSKENTMHPLVISNERKEELFEICKIPENLFPKKNKIFTALASVIEKYKITGVTVERIAAELNMAKSSLYEYFDNKNEMIKCLINKELQILQTIIIENSTEAKNFTEYIYILMASELEYFTHRPSIIPICGWLLMNNGEVSNENCEKYECEDNFSVWEKNLPQFTDTPDLGFKYPAKLITDWIKCLPVAFLVHTKGKNLTEETRMKGFMLMIDYILYGINGNEAVYSGGSVSNGGNK
ncbi:MAG: TetR/AcrR family transcriptional regulator [Treponema sp.]|nr:TetR/AcrR family transcriptional regulator [Treponema sp.]